MKNGPQPKFTSIVFCPTRSKSKDIRIIITEDKENYKIPAFEKLQLANFGSYALRNCSSPVVKAPRTQRGIFKCFVLSNQQKNRNTDFMSGLFSSQTNIAWNQAMMLPVICLRFMLLAPIMLFRRLPNMSNLIISAFMLPSHTDISFHANSNMEQLHKHSLDAFASV